MYKSKKWVVLVLTLLMAVLAAFSVSAAGINKTKLTLTVGKTAKLKVSGAKKVKWSSGNKKIAKVSSAGKVTAVKAGSTKITAKAGKKKYTCKVTVVAAKTSGAAGVTSGNTSYGAEYAMTSAEKKVYKTLISMKSRLPEGKTWGNNIFYAWDGGLFAGGYGCAAFAFKLSDAAFGTASARLHENKNNIMVGDILRVDHNSHSVIVLKKTSTGVVVAEGNYNGTVHWGRMISWKELGSTLDYVVTRY